MSDEHEHLELMPALEEPPAPEMPATAAAGALFSEESVLLQSGKLLIAESFMRMLTRECRFSEFTRELLMIAMKVVKSEAGTIFEVDYNTNTIFFRAVSGQSSDQLSNITIPMGQGIVGYVAESRQPMVVDNIEENQMHLRSIDKAVGFETRNLVAVPIIIRGRVYGVLEMLNRVGEKDYTTTDLELLNYYCEMAAKAIEVRLMLAWSARQTQGQAQCKEAA